MATPRKRWFKVADSVAMEPWSNDAAATFLRLAAHLNTRWARDGLEGPEAGRAVLRPGILLSLTGCGSVARGRRVLNELAAHISLTVTEQGANTALEWRKFPVFQGYVSEVGAGVGTVAPLAVPPPHSDSDSETHTEEEKKEEHPSGGEAPPSTDHPAPNREPLVRLLKAPDAVPAVDDAERRAWLDETGDSIDSAARLEARAACRSGEDDPPKAAVREAMLTILHKRWKAYLRSDRRFRRQLDEAAERTRLEAHRDAVLRRPVPEIEDGDDDEIVIQEVCR